MRRYYKTELRAVGEEGQAPVIEGMSTLFNVRSPNWQGFTEVVHPEFFSEVMDDDVVAMWEHDPKMPLAGVRNGTLELRISKKGVTYRFEPTATTYAQDLLVNIRSGLVNQSSFGFVPEEVDWETEEDGTVVRHLLKAAKWFDVSPVTHGYYPQTSVKIGRSLREEYHEFLETRNKVSYHDWMDLDLELLRLTASENKFLTENEKSEI